MRLDVLCSDPEHPVNTWLESWKSRHHERHTVNILHKKANLRGGDILFLVSCAELVTARERERYRQTFVLHASDLPSGRGWSPYVWELLQGATTITMSLLSAEDGVDTGAIWAKQEVHIPRHALFDEINAALFAAEVSLMDRGIELIQNGFVPTPQDPETESTYYPRRSPEDSEIDPRQPLETSFAKIRLMDPDRYPAFFRLHGYIYTIKLTKLGRDDND